MEYEDHGSLQEKDNRQAKGKLSELLGSLGDLRGFVTDGELSRWGTPAKPAMHPEAPLERLLELSKYTFTNEDDDAELCRLFELRVRVECLCLSELTEEAIQRLASKTELMREDWEAARDLARNASSGDASAGSAAARYLFEKLAPKSDDATINDLLSHLQDIGRWPGDSSSPLVREYQDTLSAAVIRHARFARRYASEIVGAGLSELLVLASLDGLREGLERFDPHRGIRPMTYASWWARQRLLRLRTQYGTDIRAPVYFWDTSVRLRRAIHRVLAERGELPSIEELANLLEPSERGHAEKIVAYGLQSPRDAWDMVGIDGESEADQLFDEEYVPPRRQAMRQALRGTLDQAINRVKDARDRDLMRRRFQWDAQDEPEVLESIGQDYGVTRERIRQLEWKALEKFAKWTGVHLKELIQEFDALP